MSKKIIINNERDHLGRTQSERTKEDGDLLNKVANLFGLTCRLIEHEEIKCNGYIFYYNNRYCVFQEGCDIPLTDGYAWEVAVWLDGYGKGKNDHELSKYSIFYSKLMADIRHKRG